MTSAHQHTFAVRVAEVLGSPAEAEDWLRRPASAFDGRRPMDLLASSEGRQLLDDYLTGLEHGGGRASEFIGGRRGDFGFGPGL
ncbi:MbcA/ParS/Xre antitoxin family protein [Rubellimicrobium mesophilum]|uniref:MbcA/ParS/Xre antitoxin family protein n=1 Tax=Rubellimicrobium mesophilum TaxID=1123067 RepID=UPI00056254A6|nr:MbcA/ParS/Xre antitoxin family protein [Rubellimicrobium mesophilum]